MLCVLCVHAHVHERVYEYACVCVCVPACTCTYVCVCISGCVCTCSGCVCTSGCVYACTYVSICTCIFVYASWIYSYIIVMNNTVYGHVHAVRCELASYSRTFVRVCVDLPKLAMMTIYGVSWALGLQKNVGPAIEHMYTSLAIICWYCYSMHACMSVNY